MTAPLTPRPLPADVYPIQGTRHLVLGPAVGRGTFGTLHVATLALGFGLRVRVAAKVLDVTGNDTEAMYGLAQTIRRVACVRHPNVVQVHELLMLDEHPCVVSELVEGCSLATLAERYEAAGRRVPLDIALFVGVEAAEGLTGARAARNDEGVMLNMSHRDLSPRQVLLSWNGEVKVSDFGTRGESLVASGVRRTGEALRRRLAALAPEVACGGPGDARADVFALGVMLHELLRGPRFDPHLDERAVFELAREGYVRRAVTDPVLPEGLAAVLDRALDPDPRVRYAHAGVMGYDLRREALALGVGDGRAFLQRALFDMTEGVLPEHDTERS